MHILKILLLIICCQLFINNVVAQESLESDWLPTNQASVDYKYKTFHDTLSPRYTKFYITYRISSDYRPHHALLTFSNGKTKRISIVWIGEDKESWVDMELVEGEDGARLGLENVSVAD